MWVAAFLGLAGTILAALVVVLVKPETEHIE
jgi:hypothetical protein